MTRAIGRDQIFQAVAKGVRSALKCYYDMSEENDSGSIPESYTQAKIADSLAVMDGNFYITMEDTYRRILTDAGAHGKAISYLNKPQQRADIVLW